MALIYRTIKGEELTWSELDGNFQHLDDIKLNKALLADNQVIIRLPAGEPVGITIPEDHALARKAGGQLTAVPFSDISAGGGASVEYVDNADAALQAQIDALEAVLDTTLKAPEAFVPAGDYPTTYGGEAITKGDSFRLAAGNMGGIVVNAEDLLVALVDAPGQVDANWQVLESNRDQATEAIKGVAKLATQAAIEDSATNNDADIVSPKKWWQGWAKGLTLASFFSAVRGTSLTGLSLADSTDVVATDTILQAIGKLQAQVDGLGGGGGLTHFTESYDSGTQATSSLTATGAGTNIGIAWVVKGNGAICLAKPDGTAVGGGVRGTNAIDLQIQRNTASKVAAGQRSGLFAGYGNETQTSDGVILGGQSHLQLGGTSQGNLAGQSNRNDSNSGVCLGGNDQYNLADNSVIFGVQNFSNNPNTLVWSSGRFATRADSQAQMGMLRRLLTGVSSGSSTELFIDGATVRFIQNTSFATNRVWTIQIMVSAICTAAGSAASLVAGETYSGFALVKFKKIGGVGTVGVINKVWEDPDTNMAGATMVVGVTSNNFTLSFTHPTDANNSTFRVSANLIITETGY